MVGGPWTINKEAELKSSGWEERVGYTFLIIMEYTANSSEAWPHFLSQTVYKSGPILVREKHSNTEVGWMKGIDNINVDMSLLKPYWTEIEENGCWSVLKPEPIKQGHPLLRVAGEDVWMPVSLEMDVSILRPDSTKWSSSLCCTTTFI